MKSKKILIIDDDPAILEALRITFEDEGYDVDVAMDGKPIEHFDGDTPDIIFLDIMLGTQDGRDLARRIKGMDLNKPVTIVMISAMDGAEASAKESGADHFVPKPFDLNRLLDLAAKA